MFDLFLIIAIIIPIYSLKYQPSHISLSTTKLSSTINEDIVKIGDYTILSTQEEINDWNEKKSNYIYLQGVKYGWGDGRHPTTKLCLDFLLENVKKDTIIIDYGTGSGILSILASKLGAMKCYGIEIDESSIESATKNVLLNNLEDTIDIVHTGRMYIGNDDVKLSDITIANILPGALNRLSSLLWGVTKPGGIICLCGMRPHQLLDIKP